MSFKYWLLYLALINGSLFGWVWYWDLMINISHKHLNAFIMTVINLIFLINYIKNIHQMGCDNNNRFNWECNCKIN